MFITPIIKILQQSIIVVTAVTIVMGISTLVMMMPQTAAYATQDEDCDSDESPASIDGTIKCIGKGECKSYEFDGKEVKHCDNWWLVTSIYPKWDRLYYNSILAKSGRNNSRNRKVITKIALAESSIKLIGFLKQIIFSNILSNKNNKKLTI